MLLIVFFIFSTSTIQGQDCNIISKANDMIPDKLCAPVSVQWEVTYRGVNDAGASVEIVFDWDDGNGPEYITAINTNPALQEWKVTAYHVYPQGGNQCNYNPNAMLVVNGVVCTGSIQEQNVTVWDVDTENGGEISINPEEFPICEGNDGSVIFNDVSLFNCVPPVENDNPNTATRWTQWVYGTSYTINNVEVNGAVRAYPYEGNIEEHTGPVAAPTPPNIASLPLYCPDDASAGQFFEVTLNYWNTCNPYEINGVPTGNPPVSVTAQIIIVPQPNADIIPEGPFCLNDPAVFYNAATPGGTWSGNGIVNSNNGKFRPSVAGAGTHIINYTVTSAAGCTNSGQTTVEVFDIPSINILPGNNAEVCPGNDLNITANVTAGSGVITNEQWTGDISTINNPSINNPIFNTNNQDIYHLNYIAEDNNGCNASENITITVNEVSANITPNPAEACVGQDFILNGNPTGGSGIYTTHLWEGNTEFLNQTNTEEVIFNCNTPGNYSLSYTVTDNNNCTGTDNVNIHVSELPDVDAGINDSICGKDYTLNGNNTNNTSTWELVTGPGTANFNDNSADICQVSVSEYGNYIFVKKVTGNTGCINTDSVNIYFIEPADVFAGINDSVCGNSYILNPVISAQNLNWHCSNNPTQVNITQINQANSEVNVTEYGEYEFIITVNNEEKCYAEDTVLIKFNPFPDLSGYPTDTASCTPFTLDIPATGLPSYNYLWTFDDGTQSSLANPQKIYENNNITSLNKTATLKIGNIHGCYDSLNINITIHPNPIAEFNLMPDYVCSPADINFTNLSTGATNYSWHIEDSIISSNNASYIFFNESTTDTVFQVKLIAESEYGCLDSIEKPAHVFSNPNYELSSDIDSACSPANINFHINPSAIQYTWNYDDGSIIPGGQTTQHLFVNPSQNPVSKNITVTAVTANGCINTANKNITVLPVPTAYFNLQENSGCAPMLFEINNLSSGADFHEWYINNDTSFINNNSILTTLIQNQTNTPISKTISVEVVNEFGCNASYASPVSIYPEVHAEFTGDTAGCSPINVNFENLSTNADFYFWNLENSSSSNAFNPTENYENQNIDPVSYPVQLIAYSSYGCSDTSETKFIEVYPLPQSAFEIANLPACAPFEALFLNTSIGAVNYNWDFGDETFSTQNQDSIYHNYYTPANQATDINVQLETENNYGCNSIHTENFTINPAPTADFSYDSAGCAPHTSTFEALPQNNTVYNWFINDTFAGNGINFSYTFENNENTSMQYIVRLEVSNTDGCSNEIEKTVLVHPQSTANFNLNNNEFCSPATVVISNNSTNFSQCLWTVNGNSFENQEELFEQHFINESQVTQTKTITLITSNNYFCNDTTTSEISIFPTPKANFNCDSTGCSPLLVNFGNTSTGQTSNYWNFNNQALSTQTNPTHSFSNENLSPDTIEVNLMVENNYHCTDSIQKEIIILPEVHTDFEPDIESSCSPVTINFTNNSIGADEYQTVFNQTDTTQSFTNSKLFINQSTNVNIEEITLIGKNQYGCTDNKNISITIFPEINAGFIADDTAGCSPMQVFFENRSDPAASYQWQFGDAGVSYEQNPQHHFINQGFNDTIFEVKLITTSQYYCSDTAIKEILVYPTPDPRFTATPLSQKYPETKVFVQNNTQGEWTYLWDFDDGFTSNLVQPVSHEYATWGTYQISLQASSIHCQNSITKEVSILAVSPTASFSADSAGCEPFTVTFSNLSQACNNYTWHFGDGSSSDDFEPTHTFNHPGTYQVYLEGINNDIEVQSEIHTITVHPKPTASFTAKPEVVEIPDATVQMYNLSDNGSFYLWNFGDGETSTDFEPFHTYQKTGQYTISLIVTTEFGCLDSTKAINAVEVTDGSEIIFPNAFTPSETGASDGHYNPEMPGTDNFVFHPLIRDVENYRLEIYTRWGELIFVSEDISYGWNGYYNGEIAKQDVYVYKATGQSKTGHRINKTGTVTLLR